MTPTTPIGSRVTSPQRETSGISGRGTPAAGAVEFFASGNAANLDGSQQGDFIYNSTPHAIATVRPRGSAAPTGQEQP